MAATSGATVETTSVTVLGGGLMGSGLARNLARAGHDVTIWNRPPDKARWLADEDGIKSVENLTDALGGLDFVLTMVFDTEAIWQVIHGALPSAPRHTTWVRTGTVGAVAAAQITEHEVSFVDAPVLGTCQPAEQGELIVLGVGDARLRDRVAPVFEAIRSRTIWVDEQPGDGHRLKLIANSWVLSATGATAQSIRFARQLGIDPALFLDVISGGPLNCGYAQVTGKAGELIRSGMPDAGTDERLTRALRDAFTEIHGAGHADEDTTAVVLAFTR